MNGMDLKARVREVAVACGRDDPRILALYLLGSVARGEERAGSDVDIAVMPEPGAGLPPLERMRLAGEMAAELLRPVDMGEISSKNLVYACEALLGGIPLYRRDTHRADLRRATLLGMYLQFNLDRREVLDAYVIRDGDAPRQRSPE